MGVVIAAAATSQPRNLLLGHGARRLADAAADRCLRRAGCSATDVDLLVNAGVYRERGLGEPALAALIQEDVAANATPGSASHGTFSFDIDNSACGILTGIHLVAGFIESGAIDVGLVVASDSAPGPLHVRTFPYVEAGGAVLLRREDRVEGLVAKRSATYPEFAGLAEGYWDWEEYGGTRSRLQRRGGRNVLSVTEQPGFRRSAAACATEVGGKLLADAGVMAEDVDLLIVTPEPGIADAVATRLGVAHTKVLHLGERLGRIHTAQPVAAIETAQHRGLWASARTVLFISAGAGLTVTASLYRH